MAQSIRPASIVRDVALLMKTNRRAAAAIAASQVPVPAKDRLVITTNGQPATWQLSALPYTGDLGSSLNLSLNGLELDEATDYSVDYTAGLVTFSSAQQAAFAATPAPADVLTADYWTTDELIANAQPVDAGSFVLNALGFDWEPTSVLFGTQAGGYPPLGSYQGPGVTFAGRNFGSTNYTGDWHLYSREIATGIVALNVSGGPLTLNPTFGMSATGFSLPVGYEIAQWVLVDHANPSSIFLEWNWAG